METTKEQKLQKILNEIVYPNVEDMISGKYRQILIVNDCFNSEFNKVKEGDVLDCGIDYTPCNDQQIEFLGYEYDIETDFIVLGRPISLELIIAALEKKGMTYIEWKRGCISFDNGLKNPTVFIAFTPLKPLSDEAVEKLIQIFES